MNEEGVRAMIASMLMQLSESLDSRIYWLNDANHRDAAEAVEEVKGAVDSVIEEIHLI